MQAPAPPDGVIEKKAKKEKKHRHKDRGVTELIVETKSQDDAAKDRAPVDPADQGAAARSTELAVLEPIGSNSKPKEKSRST